MSEKSKVIHLSADESATKESVVHIVDFGCKVTWENKSTHCPHFEIVFVGSSPAKPDDELSGTTEHPVSIIMPNEQTEFLYEVHFKKEDGTRSTYGHISRVRICPNGRSC
jgi:hypothetical protein